jgi:hypothetical protein
MVGEWARKTTSVDLPDEVEYKAPFPFTGEIEKVTVELK